MASPQMLIEASFTADIAGTPTWTDISYWVQRLSIRRGRNDELAQFRAGTATLTLRNDDRRFEPEYASSPYYPHVLPLRRIRISAIWNNITYRLFAGYVEGWPQTWQAVAGTVSISASDAFLVLSSRVFSGEFGEQTEAQRVAAVLDLVGWPSGDRAISGGSTVLQPAKLENTAALDHLQSIAESTRARCFVSSDGRLTWVDRHAINLGAYGTVQATFADQYAQTGEHLYDDLTVGYDAERVYNQTRLERSNGIVQTTQDAASIARYFARTYNKSGLLVANDNDMMSMGNWIVSRYREPRLRISKLTLDPAGNDALWPVVLSADLGTRVTVKRTPTPGATIQQTCHVEGVSMDWEARGGEHAWKRTTWELSPAEVGVTYWRLGTSRLGSETVLRY